MGCLLETVETESKMASSDLVWQLVRNQSCFIKKQKNLPVLTSEPNNLAGLNSYKFSGLANKKVVGISGDKEGDKESIVLTTSSAKKNKTYETGLKKSVKKGAAQLAKKLASYRRDLTCAATLKHKKVQKSFKKAKEQTSRPARTLPLTKSKLFEVI